MRLASFLLLALFSLPVPALAALQITSVSPAVASPGQPLVITGGPFQSGVTVLLGEEELTPETLEARRLTLKIPSLAPGQYLLRLSRDGRVSAQAFTLQITVPTPDITHLQPDTIDACQAGGPPAVSVEGSGFLPGSRLLLDGAAVPVDSISDNRIRFTPPPLSGGLHQLIVVNPGGHRSVPKGFQVDAEPVIDAVEQGSNDVTSYEVVIHGQNFLASSQLVVAGRRIPLSGARYPHDDSARYVDCNTIVLTRHPVSSQPQRVSFQVVNPGGQQSPVHYAEIP